MPSQEENFVGLFIDWDNLAISTAVDMAGAVPDVRAIVKAAQKFGTVLVARAYAEWNVSSERLSVYRAGVEPVYAPTFRFESETAGSGSKGKSLADPCLVTDCIDILHLMPEINTFVLVSGDKDLIPIVRLAQLRGKKVGVIGPDFAAAILRDMADEYIPYRQLAEASDNPPTEVSIHGARSHRRATPTARVAPAAAPAVPRSPVPSRSAPLAVAPSPLPPEPNGSDQRYDGATVTESVVEPVTSVPAEELLDPAPLYSVIGTILREREQAGKPRLRTTNLKDQLLARIPGFNERKYGFPRFKDLLAAAEKAGVLTVSRTGPVQWVSAAGQAAPAAAEATPVADLPIVAAPEPVEPAVAPAEEIDADVVEFVLGLRERSRWLTYTYVLTNLLNHLGNGAADATSDAEARVTLNRLVQAGVLVVDREPREIDVNGTRHRVRLCHVVDDHPLVQRVLAKMKDVEAEPVSVDGDVTVPVRPSEATEHLNGESAATTEAPEPPPSPVVDVASQESNTVLEPGPTDSLMAEEPVPPAAEPSPVRDVVASPLVDLPAVLASPIKSAPTENGDVFAPDVATTSAEDVSQPDGATAGEDESAASAEAAPGPSLTLAESFAVLRDVVRDATDANRPTTGPAAVKNRLVRRLGSFDERAFGFSKFKDYLVSAERAGAIRLEVNGNTTRVALASSEETGAAE